MFHFSSRFRNPGHQASWFSSAPFWLITCGWSHMADHTWLISSKPGAFQTLLTPFSGRGTRNWFCMIEIQGGKSATYWSIENKTWAKSIISYFSFEVFLKDMFDNLLFYMCGWFTALWHLVSFLIADQPLVAHLEVPQSPISWMSYKCIQFREKIRNGEDEASNLKRATTDGQPKWLTPT